MSLDDELKKKDLAYQGVVLQAALLLNTVTRKTRWKAMKYAFRAGPRLMARTNFGDQVKYLQREGIPTDTLAADVLRIAKVEAKAVVFPGGYASYSRLPEYAELLGLVQVRLRTRMNNIE